MNSILGGIDSLINHILSIFSESVVSDSDGSTWEKKSVDSLENKIVIIFISIVMNRDNLGSSHLDVLDVRGSNIGGIGRGITWIIRWLKENSNNNIGILLTLNLRDQQ